MAEGFEAHLPQLAGAIAAPQGGVKPFVRDFVRPLGLDRAATPVFVDAVEAIKTVSVESAADDVLVPVWRWLLRRIAALRDRPAFERWTLSPREQASAERLRLLREQKAIRRAMGRAEHDATRQRKLHDREARVEAYRQQQQQARARAAAERKPAAMQPSERLR